MRWGIGSLVVLAAATAWGAAPFVQWRALTAEEEKEVRALHARRDGHFARGEFEQAAKVARQVADYRLARQGAGHWQAIDARYQAEEWRRLPAVPPKDRAEVLRARGLDSEAMRLVNRGRAREANELFRQALAIRERVLGEAHPDTANSCNNVAHCLQAQGKPAEALPLFQKALRVSEKALGEEHPDTANSCNNVASCLQELGRAAEALPLFHKALRARERALGGEHPDTADACNNLASCLRAQGKPAEALPLHRKALAIREKALGGEHPRTAQSCNNLALCLHDQGRAAEALPLLLRALRVSEKALGEEHPDTALSCGNLASCLYAQGKPAEALPLLRKALRVSEKALGEEHPDTADACNNVAACLQELSRAAEALPLYRKALRVNEKALGGEHPRTARSYNNLALCLRAQGKPAEALPLHRKALAIREKALGEAHPDTAQSYNNLASCLWEQGRRNEAVRLWQASLRGQEAARVHRAGSGFDRAQHTRGISPRAALAVGLAHLGQPVNAFAQAEASLARGLLDDLAPLTPAEAARARELRARLSRLDPALASFSAGGEPAGARKASRDAARREYGHLWRELSDLLAAASARSVLPAGRIQKAIPPDTALVLWVEHLGERWACVLRAEGAPAWQRLGKDARASLATPLYEALTSARSGTEEREKLLAALRKERFDPLLPRLKGVKRLLVVPTGDLAYVPAELLAGDFAVSYVPSGSMLALLREKHRALDGSSLLALGDPAFDRAVPPEPPASGVLVRAVLPGGSAAKAGLKPGDVVLSVGGVATGTFDEVDAARKGGPAAVTYWREGSRLKGKLPGGPLGAVLDRRSARAAVRAWRRDNEALARRGTGHKRLPGTRLEVEAIAPLFKRSSALLGSDASEQRLDGLVDSGELRRARVIHLATHGEAVPQAPSRSALILAQDRLPDPLAQVGAGRHVYDGRLTVSRVRARWDLDADLVVLSACETALGKDAGGDGLLGFAHAFLSKGARSVVLTRWKVDDSATALLMVRFYENLLARRKGLDKAMGRAAALSEAKRWLRELPRKEAERLAALHYGGVLRGREADQKPPGKAKPVQLKGERPYEHPFYWAAFTLVGDPD